MFTGFRHNSVEYARCICDTCEHQQEVPATLGHTPDDITNLSVVVRKLQRGGWSYIGKRLLCPQCEADRKSKRQQIRKAKETTVTIQEPIRQPTKEQKREIIDMLGAAYDTKAQRYKGHDTDKTVAEAIGPNIMWGWVAQLREEFFGPEGNEAADEALKAIREWQAKADKMSKELHDSVVALQSKMREFNAAREEVAKLVATVGKVKV